LQPVAEVLEIMVTLRTLSIAALLLMAVALVGLVATDSLFSSSPIAIGAQLSALALMVWARVTLGRRSFHAGADPTPGGLITTGPFHYIRYPIYTAACVFGWTGVAAHWSGLAMLLGLLLFVGGLGRMLCEERLVAEQYPEYRDYARKTRRMMPYVF